MRKEVIGRCTLHQGDCLEILPQISGADAVITDPPYFLTVANDAKAKINPWANVLNCAVFAQAWMRLAFSVLRHPGVLWSCMNWQSIPSFSKAAFDCGHAMKSLLVWDKATIGPGVIGLRPRYECVDFFPVGGFAIADRSISDIWEIPWASFKPNGHPSEKPEALMTKLIDISCGKDGIILDPFMGSGTTGAAAVKSGRRFIGIEQDQRWFDVACQRVELAYADRALLEAS